MRVQGSGDGGAICHLRQAVKLLKVTRSLGAETEIEAEEKLSNNEWGMWNGVDSQSSRTFGRVSLNR